MLSTASYEARQYGVRSAMPGFIAKQLCPSLTIVPLNFDKYRTASSQTREVFATFDRDYRAYSLDEASLDVTDYLKTHPDVTAAEVAARLRSLVFQKTQLTCSVGIAPTRKIAKICSDLRKPNGQYELEANRQAIVDFMKELPVGKVSGIGKVTERLLKSLDITQCGQLYEKRALLVRLFKPSTAEFFLRTSLGLPSNSEQKPKRQRKSISKERTFRDSSSEVFLLDKCRELSKKLASSLAKKGLAAKNVTIKLKTHDFQVLTRSSTMTSYISSEEDIYNAASKLLRKEMPITLRLFGVRLSSFPSSLAAAADDSSAGNNAQKTIDRFFCNSSSSHNKRRTDILLSSNEAKDVEGKRQIGLAGQNVEENAAVTSPLLPSESPKRQRTDATIASTPVIIPRRIPLTTPSTSASSASSTPTKVMTLTSNRTAVSPSKKSSTTSKRRRSSWSCGVKDQQQPTITSFFVRPQ
ncbi:DNA polymerase IV, variant 2 [Balamuthia mandrillaris]